jgi:hypothetical protein
MFVPRTQMIVVDGFAGPVDSFELADCVGRVSQVICRTVSLRFFVPRFFQIRHFGVMRGNETCKASQQIGHRNNK